MYAFEEKLASSGLDLQDAATLGFEETCMCPGVPVGHGFVIPYFDLAGQPTSFYRYRYLESLATSWDRLAGRRELRYAQPRGTTNEVYLPPFVDWRALADDAAKPLVITEGELKSACATKHGIPTIGLGGVWCWRKSKDHLPMLPIFDEIKWTGRAVCICYDSDAVSNHKVAAAENALADALLQRGAKVFIARIPGNGAKVGMDDLIVTHGVKALSVVLDAAEAYKGVSELFKLNEEVVYVREPGVILRTDTFQKMSPAAFREHAFANRVFYREITNEKGNTTLKRCSAPEEWLRWAGRAEAWKLTYLPGQPVSNAQGELNMWRGWGTEPAPGDVQPFLDLFNHVFAGLSDSEKKWVMQWMAYPLQYPGTKLYTSVLVWSVPHGTGKSFLGYILGKIYGKNFVKIGNSALHSSFNEWAENRQFVLGEEIAGSDKRGVMDGIKDLITQHEFILNVKWVSSFTIPDCINYWFTSNRPDALFLEDGDRRVFVHEVSGPPPPPEFFAPIDKWFTNGGAAHAFDYLLNVDLTGFNPKAPAPLTAAKSAMISESKSDIALWVSTLRESPDAVLHVGGRSLASRDLWTSQDLLAVYDPNHRTPVTANGITRELRRAGFTMADGGRAIPTCHGRLKLWIVQHPERYSDQPASYAAKTYEASLRKP